MCGGGGANRDCDKCVSNLQTRSFDMPATSVPRKGPVCVRVCVCVDVELDDLGRSIPSHTRSRVLAYYSWQETRRSPVAVVSMVVSRKDARIEDCGIGL